MFGVGDTDGAVSNSPATQINGAIRSQLTELVEKKKWDRLWVENNIFRHDDGKYYFGIRVRVERGLYFLVRNFSRACTRRARKRRYYSYLPEKHGEKRPRV